MAGFQNDNHKKNLCLDLFFLDNPTNTNQNKMKYINLFQSLNLTDLK